MTKRLPIFVLLLMPLLDPTGPALAQTIALRGEATVDTVQVTLGQIAKIETTVEGEAESVGKLVVRAAPELGARMNLTLAELRDRLSELGINRAVWTLQGSSTCQISRVEGAPQQITQLQERSEKMRAGMTGTPAALPEEALPDSLAGCIQKLLESHYRPADGKLTVAFEPADKSVLTLQRPQFRFELAIKKTSENRVDVAAKIFAMAIADPVAKAAKPADSLVKEADIRVRVGLSAPIVIAKKTINRGQVIAADDVELSVRPVTLTSAALRELPAAVGQQAKRMIRSEETVTAADLTPLAIVHRNKLVTVWSRNGGLLIKTVGRAMQDGSFGEKILVRNETAKQPFYGVVSGPDTVELDPTPVEEARKRPAGPTTAPEGGAATGVAQR